MRAVMAGQHAEAVYREAPEDVVAFSYEQLFASFGKLAEASNSLTGHLQRTDLEARRWNVSVHAGPESSVRQPGMNVLAFAVTADVQPDGDYAMTWVMIQSLAERINRIGEEIELRRLDRKAGCCTRKFATSKHNCPFVQSRGLERPLECENMVRMKAARA